MSDHKASAWGSCPIAIGKPRVLLAEDDVSFRQLVAAGLRRAGYDVLEVADGAEALDLIGESLSSSALEAPDVIVSDIRMPHLTGLHVAASVRGISPQIPTILTTAFGDPETHALADRLGAVTTLDKPFDINRLREMIDKVLHDRPGRPRVLVVDESVVQASALSEILCDEGASATFATTAVDALAAVARDAPDIVVLEAKVRGEGGDSLLARMREYAPTLAAVVVTAYTADNPHVAAMIEAGAAYAAKPVDIARVVRLIQWLVKEQRCWELMPDDCLVTSRGDRI